MMILLTDNYNKKAWRSVSVTRPTLRGSRIAQYSRTSNAEPTPMSLYNPPLGFASFLLPIGANG